jgi:hypothetical protein
MAAVLPELKQTGPKWKKKKKKVALPFLYSSSNDCSSFRFSVIFISFFHVKTKARTGLSKSHYAVATAAMVVQQCKTR